MTDETLSAARVGRAIRERRAQRGWTQHQFAEKIGQTRNWVAAIESGKLTTVSGDQLQAVVHGFKMDLQEFVDGAKDSETPEEIIRRITHALRDSRDDPGFLKKILSICVNGASLRGSPDDLFTALAEDALLNADESVRGAVAGHVLLRHQGLPDRWAQLLEVANDGEDIWATNYLPWHAWWGADEKGRYRELSDRHAEKTHRIYLFNHREEVNDEVKKELKRQQSMKTDVRCGVIDEISKNLFVRRQEFRDFARYNFLIVGDRYLGWLDTSPNTRTVLWSRWTAHPSEIRLAKDLFDGLSTVTSDLTDFLAGASAKRPERSRTNANSKTP